jgi:2-polyprenyl-3-methyl-5-hydroxy-6-metoxy-1,4-benzoquinol methylase
MGKSGLEEPISDVHCAANSEYERTSKVFSRRLVPTDRPLRILDVGCGTGLNARHFAAMGHTVVGTDVSSVAIQKFQNGLDGIVCDMADAGVPLADASFDLVFASEVIEHIADTAKFLAELGRLVRPRGTLILSTPVPPGGSIVCFGSSAAR